MTAYLCLIISVILAWTAHRLESGQKLTSKPDMYIDSIPVVFAGVGYLLFVSLLGMPLLSLCIVVAVIAALWIANKFKLSLYDEPSNFMDIFLLVEIFRQPHFYKPYLIPRRVLIIVTASLVSLISLVVYEAAIPLSVRVPMVVLCVIALVGTGFVMRLFFGRYRQSALTLLDKYPLSLNSKEDWLRYGMLPSMYLQGLWHIHKRSRNGEPGISRGKDAPSSWSAWPKQCLGTISEPKPHILMVQAESFFDVRRISSDIDTDIFRHFDEIAEEGVSGELFVPTRGAYTMRTEFSALTGVGMQHLGTDAYNPYFTPARRPVWSLAHFFKKQGYRTLCIHPFTLAFFRRDKVMPNLGFDEVWGEERFEKAERYGPFVSDDALAKVLLNALQGSTTPTFVFAISMESHGPWAPGRLGKMGYDFKPPSMPVWGSEAMATYLTHLRNTDRMINTLASGLRKKDHPATMMCLYGDHIGTLPTLCENEKCENSNTNYFMWRSDQSLGGRNKDVAVEDLGGLLLSELKKG